MDEKRKIDEALIENIVDFLRSEDVDSIISTCEFLETVVNYDFPAEIFLHQRDLVVVSLSKSMFCIRVER